MRAVSFSEARSHLKSVFDRVVDDADITIITRRDAKDVVVMSLAEWNSWQETEYLLASPANARHLREAIARLDAGDAEHHDLIKPQHEGPSVHDQRAPYDAGSRRKAKPGSDRKRRK